MADIARALANKTLVMVVGPAAVGKSTLMHAVAEQDSRFGYVRSFTTRPDRGDAQSTYRHISEEDAMALKASGKTVTFVRHPTTGFIYGTDASSYLTEFNVLDTLSGTVDAYRTLPFKNTITVSLTTDPDAWQAWLLKRYPVASHERTKRLNEAVLSIEWSLSQTQNHSWLVNPPNGLNDTSRRLIEITSGQAMSTNIPPEAEELLKRAKILLSYE